MELPWHSLPWHCCLFYHGHAWKAHGKPVAVPWRAINAGKECVSPRGEGYVHYLSFGPSTAAGFTNLHGIPRPCSRRSTDNRGHSMDNRGHSTATAFHGLPRTFHGLPRNAAASSGTPWRSMALAMAIFTAISTAVPAPAPTPKPRQPTETSTEAPTDTPTDTPTETPTDTPTETPTDLSSETSADIHG